MRAASLLLVLSGLVACARGPAPGRTAMPSGDVLPDADAGADAVIAAEAEGTFFVAGVVEAITPAANLPPGSFDVVVSEGGPTPACQLAVTLPAASGPLRVGVDGVRARGLRVYLDAGDPLPFAVGDHLCGLVDRRRVPPFYIAVELVLVDGAGVVRLAYSSTSGLGIAGWSFASGDRVVGSKRVPGGVERWRAVRVEHGGAAVDVGLGAWPLLEAGGQRYQVMALAYEKTGRLVPEEAPHVRNHGILWRGVVGR